LGAGLRVAAGAGRGVDLLEGDPAGDRDLLALGDVLGDGREQRVEHARDGRLALARRAGDAGNELGLGDSHGVVLQTAACAASFTADRTTRAAWLVGWTGPEYTQDPLVSADFRPTGAIFSGVSRAEWCQCGGCDSAPA